MDDKTPPSQSDGAAPAGAGAAHATLEDIGARVGELVARFEAHPQVEVRDAVFELLEGIDALHRAGVSRLVELLMDSHGESALAELAADPLAAPVLELYDLLPLDERTQVEDALEAVRPYIHSHGGEVEVLGIVDGIVHVQLAGSCHGCSGSTVTLRRGVEEALREGYPGFRGIEVHETTPSASPPPAGFIGLDQLKVSAERLRRPEWTVVAQTGEVQPGTVRGFDVQDLSVLLCNLGGEVYGFSDKCPQCSMPLRDGKLSGTVLVCPWQNCAYDARTGKRVDGEEGGRLEVYPVAVVDGTVKLALNVPGTPPVTGTR
jgi:Fe-S cluster biogenesis protein NfuA/nitrite reductase/ring-hydroxylating ferredoxin subunit